MLQAQAKVRRINKARKEEEMPADKDEVVEEEGVKLVGEAEAAMQMSMIWTTILLVFPSGLPCSMKIREEYLNKFLTT